MLNMRFRFHRTLILLACLLVVTGSGCSLFSKSDKSKGSLFGLKRRGPKQDLSDEALDPLGARNSNRLLWDDLSPGQIGTTFKTRGGKKLSESEAERHLAEGKRLYDRGTQALQSNPGGDQHQKIFAEAANEFRLASAYYPDSSLEEDAVYLEGESYFFADRYVQSNRAFEKLVANYSGTRYLDMAEQRRLTIALYWLDLSDHYKGPKLGDPKRPKTGLAGEARRVLHRIRIDDPTGKLADDATLALGKAFMKDQRFYEAADTFEDLRRNYPGSQHQFTAHMLELEARLQGYQGKSYDDTPLRKADELMKTIVRQFPSECKDELPYLERQAALIQNQIAERDYSMGEYFENRGENRAAKFYYQQIAEKYDNTKFGETIRQQIADVEQRPPVPKQHGQWIIDMFPKNEDEKALIAAGDNENLLR